MSFQALKAVMADPARTAAEQSVLVVLAWHAGRQAVPDRDGQLAYECWPSVATIGREAGLAHEATARRVLRRLERAGRIERVPSSGRRTNRYRIPTRIVREPSVQGSVPTLHAKSGQPCTADVGELTVNDAYVSTSDLDTRARDDEGDDGMSELDDAARRRVRAALTVLAERALVNEPDLGNMLAARAAQMVHLRDLTALAARHPQLTPEQLASWVDYAVAIGGDQDSAHYPDHPDDAGLLGEPDDG